MDKRILATHLLAALAAFYSLPVLAQSEAAQVLFTSDKLTVIDARGVERVARQGDFLNPGDRIVTPPGVIGQIKLPDGTLISARPDSEIKLDTIDRAKGKNVLQVNHGNVRVINIDLPNRPKPQPIDVVTPISTLQLIDGDGEAIHVKPGNKANVEAGTYTRLQLGTALMRNPKGDLPLTPLQGGFVPRPDIVPMTIAMLPPSLANFTPTIGTLAPRPPTTTAPIATGTPLAFAPTVGTSVLTSPTLAGIAPLPTNMLIQPGTPLAGSAPAPNPAIAQPTVGTPLIQPAVLSNVAAPTIKTAIMVRPPPPPPPPPPPKYTFIKKIP